VIGSSPKMCRWFLLLQSHIASFAYFTLLLSVFVLHCVLISFNFTLLDRHLLVMLH
jgi:hypothetical protein